MRVCEWWEISWSREWGVNGIYKRTTPRMHLSVLVKTVCRNVVTEVLVCRADANLYNEEEEEK